MAGKIEWINYKGKEILLNNRSKLKSNEIVANVNEAVNFIKNSGKTEILYLIDNRENIISPEVKDKIKASGKELSPYLKKSAVIGANNAQKILLGILSQFAKIDIMIFDDIEKAKGWLIK
jgi:hypothetical protein